MKARLPVIVGLLLLPACHNGAGQAAPKPCTPVADSLSLSVTGESLAGEYRLRLVSDRTPRGATAAGSLSLVLQDSGSWSRAGPGGLVDSTHRYPLIGAGELDLVPIGAVAPGGTASLDPAAPGVLAIERLRGAPQAPGRLLLRLGSETNRIDRLRFDGGYTVLRVRRADQHGFAGEWESGTPMPRAAGYFCAERTGER